ncbi:unnamed protein product [Rhizophagus irregularis]|uniref:Uncharacterized protein n=1 Tax=Rhizophagus irregularis TaxID=588596 RepID=A0A2N1M1Q2_9GLOM|nr:hypothetical protein RhiirC2_802135 [Rhizophagus irregularis]CAB4392337.1 unnamed protein product [Rhizophagus irregularis]
MNTIHNSNVSTHNPGCDLMVYTIEASDSIHSKYEELSDFLFEKDSYKFFDLDKYTSHDVTPAVIQTLYFDLTGDASTTNNVISKEIEERLRIMMQLEDPLIIVDLHTNNGFKGKKF